MALDLRTRVNSECVRPDWSQLESLTHPSFRVWGMCFLENTMATNTLMSILGLDQSACKDSVFGPVTTAYNTKTLVQVCPSAGD